VKRVSFNNSCVSGFAEFFFKKFISRNFRTSSTCCGLWKCFLLSEFQIFLVEFLGVFYKKSLVKYNT